MNKTRRLTDRFRQIRGEGDDVMVGSLFDLMDAVDRKLGFALNLFECLARDRPHLGVYFTDSDLYVQPFLELGLFRPKRTHFGQSVSFNHWAVTSTDYADYTDLRKEKKSQIKPRACSAWFCFSAKSADFLSYFRAVELTKYLARYHMPPCSTNVNVSMPWPRSKEV